jgi:hypothetical protein
MSAETTPALKPCPFCGGPAQLEEYIGHYHKEPSWCIVHSGCPGEIDLVSKDPEIVAAAWNRRDLKEIAGGF